MEPNRAYQAEMIAQCQQHLNSVGKVVLAAGCGAGKTRMATEMLVEFLRANPDKKVLFLAHATRSLRKQVATALAGDERFTSIEVTPNVKSAELEDAAVHIAIPQSGAIREQRYGMIVVDEAHQYYFGDMITGIIASNPEAKQLLLTASHWRFTLTGAHPVVTRSQLELLDDGVISDIETRMLPTSQEFRKFSAAGDLAESEELGNVKQLATFVKKWARGFTLVACHNQKAARDICKALGSQAIISTCEDDPNDRSIEEFRKAGSTKYLVVVFRGVLGLDMPELETVMDLTATKNVDRVYQLMGRVVRLCEGKQPLYVKMAPKIQLEYYQHVMSGTLHLAHPEYYRKWNGKLDSLWLTVHKSNAKPSKVRHGSRPLPKFESLLPRWSELRPLLERAESEDNEYFVATLGGIRDKINGFDPTGNKGRILDFCRLYGRLPSQHVTEERNLYHLLTEYCRKNRGTFDPGFAEEVSKYKQNRKLKSQTAIKKFISETGRQPSTSAEDVHERVMGSRFYSYVIESSKLYDKGFSMEVDELLGGKERRTAAAKERRVASTRRRVLCIETGERFKSTADAVRFLGQKSAGHLYRHLGGLIAHCKGYTFRYLDEEGT